MTHLSKAGAKVRRKFDMCKYLYIFLISFAKNCTFSQKQLPLHPTMPITIEHINKHYGKQQVLHDVSLRLEDNEVVGLLGPNGAGKTTLMKILLGIIKADKDTEHQPKAVGPLKAGYLPEQNPLYLDMYVKEYLQFIAGLTHSKDEVEPLIERVGLQPEAGKRIGELSKGYKQRVGLASALMGNPELVVLDEPTTGLDPNQIEDIRQIIREEGKKRTVILSTHILQEVKEMCSRVVIIDHGHIRADRQIDEIDNLEEFFRSVTRSETKEPTPN